MQLWAQAKHSYHCLQCHLTALHHLHRLQSQQAFQPVGLLTLHRYVASDWHPCCGK
jgi:hypothetical protein